jgi:hypothetical protein
MSNRIKLGELLVRAGVLDDQKLRAALAEQARWGGRIGRILVIRDARLTTLHRAQEGLAIQENTQITRYNYTLTARYELRDAVSNEVLDKGTARAIAAYNVVDSQFGTQSAERDAQERAAREVGEDIRLRIGLYFENRFGSKN